MGILVTTPAEKAASNAIFAVQAGFSQLVKSGTIGFNHIWNEPVDPTNKSSGSINPELIWVAFGTRAKSMRDMAVLNITTIMAACQIAGIDPPAMPVVPDGYTLDFNEDGSIKTPMYTAPTPTPTPTPTP